jgi:hypothetical protein
MVDSSDRSSGRGADAFLAVTERLHTCTEVKITVRHTSREPIL